MPWLWRYIIHMIGDAQLFSLKVHNTMSLAVAAYGNKKIKFFDCTSGIAAGSRTILCWYIWLSHATFNVQANWYIRSSHIKLPSAASTSTLLGCTWCPSVRICHVGQPHPGSRVANVMLCCIPVGHDRSIRMWDIASKSCVFENTTHRHKFDEVSCSCLNLLWQPKRTVDLFNLGCCHVLRTLQGCSRA